MFPVPHSTLLMTDESLLSKMKTVKQSLEALRTELQSIRYGISSTDPISNPEKEEVINRNAQNIELGLGEAQLLVALLSHLKSIDVERQTLRIQVKGLCQETSWLRDEVKDSQQQLLEAQLKIVQLEEEKRQMEFTASIKKYDDFLEGVEFDEKFGDDPAFDLFPEDEIAERRLSKSTPTPSQHYPDYEVSPRLKTIQNLALNYASKGRYEVAVPLCKQALEDLERENGREHPDVATMLSILTMVYRDQNNLPEAIKHMNEALGIWVRCLGECHPSVAAALNNLAVLYGKNGNYKEAESLCKRALANRENVLGRYHPDVAKQLNNLALLCQNQGKHGEVELYIRRALEIFESQLGVIDPNAIKTKCNLAACCLKLRKYKEADQLLRDVLVKTQDKEFDEVQNGDSESINVDNTSYGKSGAWHETAVVHSPTVKSILKHMASLHQRLGNFDVSSKLKHGQFRSKQEILDIVDGI
ncbi:AAEL014967-PA [Aedes aegypti]|uniref:Kinesin light chain n=1 Tax=Aedes aegypti TaxID=7159 RepID=Q16EY6_AEDAE|nr:AAEL014967-PA [Aedes aegypti]